MIRPQNAAWLVAIVRTSAGDPATAQAVTAVMARPPAIQPYTARRKVATRSAAWAGTAGEERASGPMSWRSIVCSSFEEVPPVTPLENNRGSGLDAEPHRRGSEAARITGQEHRLDLVFAGWHRFPAVGALVPPVPEREALPGRERIEPQAPHHDLPPEPAPYHLPLRRGHHEIRGGIAALELEGDRRRAGVEDPKHQRHRLPPAGAGRGPAGQPKPPVSPGRAPC